LPRPPAQPTRPAAPGPVADCVPRTDPRPGRCPPGCKATNQAAPDNVRRPSSGSGSMLVAGQCKDEKTYALSKDTSKGKDVQRLERQAMLLLTAAVDSHRCFDETAASIRVQMDKKERRHGWEDAEKLLSDCYVLSCECPPPLRSPLGQMKMIQTACAWKTTCGTRHTATTRTSRGVSAVSSRDALGRRSGGFSTCQRWARTELSHPTRVGPHLGLGTALRCFIARGCRPTARALTTCCMATLWRRAEADSPEK
jgi:hypothetical protein